MHSPHAEKIETVPAAPSSRPLGSVSVTLLPPRSQQTRQPGSFENMNISEIKKKKKSGCGGRTRYIGLNIYTEAIRNCTARAPGRRRPCAAAGQPGLLL